MDEILHSPLGGGSADPGLDRERKCPSTGPVVCFGRRRAFFVYKIGLISSYPQVVYKLVVVKWEEVVYNVKQLGKSGNKFVWPNLFLKYFLKTKTHHAHRRIHTHHR